MRRIYKLKLWSILLISLVTHQGYAQQYDVVSPSGLLKLSLNIDATATTYTVSYNGTSLIEPSAIAVSLNNGIVLGVNSTIADTETRTVSAPITRLYGKNELSENFKELKINFTQNYSLIVRAYDEGVAYRFVTAMGGNVIVDSETATFNLAGTPGVLFPEADVALQSWERSYSTYASITDIPTNRFAITPTMFSYSQSGIRVVVAESDLFDYPGMYVQRTVTGMKGKWAQYPKTVSDPTDVYKYHRVLSRESYIAKTTGTREYPWRVIIVSTDDKDLLNNELIYKLAKPSVLGNTSYIKPGKSAWEWWHDAILETTSIPSGLNNLNYNLYKYYVDFAAECKLEYMTLDAGYSQDYLAQLCQYADTKNVKIFVWDFVNLPVENPGRLAQLKNLGVAGVKIDLIERDDQIAINWFEQIAQDCADHELMVIFHGCGKPTGLQRTYPNIVNFEAVLGAENDKFTFSNASANADYHLQFPFIRMLAGPLDYTPGSMRNVHKSQYSATTAGIPMSIGTRAHELAMYVLFDQPLAYLCDSPTEYRKFPDIMKFFSNVSTTWDKTVPLKASVGKYAIIARQKGEDWYVGAMTNAEGRDVEIDFSFLPVGVEQTAEVFRDSDFSDGNAKLYRHEFVTVTSQSKLTYHLAPEGGLAMRINDDVVTGMVGDEKDSGIYIYQSIDRTQLTIQAKETIQSITILDVSGRTLYQETFDDHQSIHRTDVRSFSSGVYVVHVTTASQFYSSKFIR